MSGNERNRADHGTAMDGTVTRAGDNVGKRAIHDGSGQSMTGGVFRQHDPALEQTRWLLEDAVASRTGGDAFGPSQLAASRRFERVFLSSRAYDPLYTCSVCRPWLLQCVPWDKSDTGGYVENGGLKSSRVQVRGARRGLLAAKRHLMMRRAVRGLAPYQESGASNDAWRTSSLGAIFPDKTWLRLTTSDAFVDMTLIR